MWYLKYIFFVLYILYVYNYMFFNFLFSKRQPWSVSTTSAATVERPRQFCGGEWRTGTLCAIPVASTISSTGWVERSKKKEEEFFPSAGSFLGSLAHVLSGVLCWWSKLCSHLWGLVNWVCQVLIIGGDDGLLGEVVISDFSVEFHYRHLKNFFFFFIHNSLSFGSLLLLCLGYCLIFVLLVLFGWP